MRDIDRPVPHEHNIEKEIREHSHYRGADMHRHDRGNGKTYFNYETRSDGLRVKCEGHPTVDFDITDDWAYPK